MIMGHRVFNKKEFLKAVKKANPHDVIFWDDTGYYYNGSNNYKVGVCKCGHSMYYHDTLNNQACHLLDCDCKRFKGVDKIG